MTLQEAMELSEEELRGLWRKGLVEIGVKGEPGEPGITRDLPNKE